MIGEYDFAMRQLYQINDAQTLMLEVAKCYQENEEMVKDIDSVMGEGASKYIGEAIEAFYTR